MQNGSSPKPPKRSLWPETMRTVAQYTNLGWTLVASVALGVFVGRWADKHFGTEPWFLLLGSVLGIAVGLYYFLATVLRK